MTFEGWDAAAAERFCSEWLPAWTGNDPDRLLSFYAPDAFYSDPAVPGGLHGREALRGYFAKLLAAFPEWRWAHLRSVAMEDGFLNYWRAWPGTDDDAPFEGVCVVRLKDGLIFRNEVFFDRPDLLRRPRTP